MVGVEGEVWVIDPGPDDPAHLEALAGPRGAAGTPCGVALTHDHLDHSAGRASRWLALTRRRGDLLSGVPLASTLRSADLHTPGHAADHLVFWVGDGAEIALFSGDLMLGQSSTIVPPGGGTLIAYLESLEQVAAIGPRLILPGHGEPIEDAAAAVGQSTRASTAARGAICATRWPTALYDREALLDRVWSDVARVAADRRTRDDADRIWRSSTWRATCQTISRPRVARPGGIETERWRAPDFYLNGGVALNSRSTSAAAGFGIAVLVEQALLRVRRRRVGVAAAPARAHPVVLQRPGEEAVELRHVAQDAHLVDHELGLELVGAELVGADRCGWPLRRTR